MDWGESDGLGGIRWNRIQRWFRGGLDSWFLFFREEW